MIPRVPDLVTFARRWLSLTLSSAQECLLGTIVCPADLFGGRLMKRLIYICHPFRDDPPGNAERVRVICAALKRECVPLAPQLLLPGYIDEASERELALFHCLRLVAAADEVRVFGNKVTGGMAREIVEARRLGIPVVFADDQNGDDPRADTSRAVGAERARC